MRRTLYQFRPFGELLEELPSIERYAPSDAAAIARAGTIAKRNQGPVDIAVAGDAPWDERYITTVAPSEFHAKGFRAERLT